MNVEFLVEKLREIGYNATLLDPMTVNLSDDGSGFLKYVLTDSGYDLVFDGVVAESYASANELLRDEMKGK